MPSKNLYIISGCNGAGKTTVSYTVLPEVLVFFWLRTPDLVVQRVAECVAKSGQEKAMCGEDIIVCGADNNIQRIPASQVIASNQIQ